MIKLLVLYLIKFYQKFLSPDQSFYSKYLPFRFCRFYPSCSEYSYQAIKKYGLLKGGLLSIYRILRCNPFSKGGIDKLK